MSPMRPKKPCRFPGCPALTYDRFCPDHALVELTHVTSRKHTNPAFAMIDSWYDSRDWRALKAEQLRRFPFCAACSREYNPVIATEVDHIRPIRLGGRKRDFTNFQSLCKPCHDRKRQQESMAVR